jgi:tRNA A-37 threonylcarbamoyl transferase component Bud32
VIINYYIVPVYMTQWCATFHRLQIFKLVYDLHSLGIAHGDLEPRNVVRTDGGKFLLIDFTESGMHRSKKCVAQNVRQLVVDSHCIYELTFE